MKIFRIIIFLISLIISNSHAIETMEKPLLDGNDVVPNQRTLQWYHNSAEAKALFQQTFSIALDQIKDLVSEKKLATKSWTVVFALEGTLLDASEYQSTWLRSNKSNSEHAYYPVGQLNVIPGATNISCKIQEMGGRVIIVSNSVGSGEKGKNLIQTTEDNLSQQKICYDSIVFANDNYDRNKNPRFTAISSGDYENVITTKTFAPLNVIAYIGSDIQDFPNYKQSTTKDLPIGNQNWDKFGEEYFILPNPFFGSWKNNSLK